MIVSLVGEEFWLREFKVLPVWVPDGAPMLVVVPHPDDETLGAGGLIAAQRRAGVEVTVACVTDGENAYPEENCAAELAATRRLEQAAALGRLGVAAESIVRLGLVDSDVGAREEELAELLVERARAATVIAAPWIVAPWEGDFHPDHEACGRAAARAAELTGARLISYFFWTWHRGTPENLRELELVKFTFGDDIVETKAAALAMHASQLVRPDGEAILPERLLHPTRRNFEVFAIR